VAVESELIKYAYVKRQNKLGSWGTSTLLPRRGFTCSIDYPEADGTCVVYKTHSGKEMQEGVSGLSKPHALRRCSPG
jgi:hypothetical protein